MDIYKKIFCVIWASLFFSEAIAGDVTTIQLYYNNRAPYHVTDAGNVSGVVADIVSDIFEKAAISYQWVETPPKRQLLEVKSNQQAICASGWFWREERAVYGLYTNAIYQDSPQGVVGLRNNENILKHRTLASLVADEHIVALTNLGFSYGSYIDNLMQKSGKPPIIINAENIKMLQLLSYKRADFIFIAPEEANFLLAASDTEVASKLALYEHFTDSPQGEKRYLICSQAVGKDVIDRLNEAIEVTFTDNKSLINN